MLLSINYLFIIILILFSYYQTIDADEVIITGDIKTLINLESNYNINVKTKYFPLSSYHFKYIYNIPELNYHYEHFTQSNNVEWKNRFDKNGTYQFNVQVYFYPFFETFYGWKIAETTVSLEIYDNLDNFITINSFQNETNLTTDFVFAVNKTINFSPEIDKQSILMHYIETMSYEWLVDGPDINQTKFEQKKFDFIFKSLNEYIITLKILSISNELSNFTGKKSEKIQIKSPINNITINGNNFVENGSLLHLNISCDGSANFLICHRFSSIKSNESCFNHDGNVLSVCNYQIIHYFPQNGTKYINIGIRNDVSIVYRNVKITIYKIGPKPSFAFVIIPLVSLLLIIIIAVYGIIHFIRQRRRMNATIEVATNDNFSIYNNELNLQNNNNNDNNTNNNNNFNYNNNNDEQTLLGEKTFYCRVKDSFIEQLCPKI